jgi:glycosyltransferase involved in cell wall biosynthesis
MDSARRVSALGRATEEDGNADMDLQTARPRGEAVTGETPEAAGRPEGPLGGRRLRILTCPHELVRGGSQIIAIQLAAELRDRGHEVLIYSFPGPLSEYVASFGLPFHEATPFRGAWMRPFRLIEFLREIRRFRPDIVHTYEAHGSVASGRAALVLPHHNVTTVSSMDVPDFIPEDVPLLVGTARLAAGQTGRMGGVELMEPVVDTEFDAPRDADDARRRLGLPDGELVVSVVGRLSEEHHKARGVVAVIEDLAARELPRPITVIVAGAGDREDEVRAAAAAAGPRNAQLTIRLEGDVADPRDIYDAAHITVGMGSSGIRAMAHAKPLIVQGRDGFCQLLDEESADSLASECVFGYGESGGPSVGELILDLAERPERRSELGALGRALVLRRFSHRSAADLLERVYAEELERPRPRRRRMGPVLRSTWRYLRFRAALASPALQGAYRALTRKRA